MYVKKLFPYSPKQLLAKEQRRYFIFSGGGDKQEALCIEYQTDLRYMYSTLKKFKRVPSVYINKARTYRKYKLFIHYLNGLFFFPQKENCIWLLPHWLK